MSTGCGWRVSSGSPSGFAAPPGSFPAPVVVGGAAAPVATIVVVRASAAAAAVVVRVAGAGAVAHIAVWVVELKSTVV